MAHATAERTTEEQVVTTRTERHVEVVTRAGPPWLLILVIGAGLGLLAGLIALLIAAATDDGPAVVDEPPAGPLEGAIHWRTELAARSFPAAVDDARSVLLLGNDTRPGVDQPADVVAINLATGRELWRSTISEPFVRPHGVTGEIAIATAVVDETRPTDVVAFDVRTGKELWRQTFEERAPAPRVLEDHVLTGGSALVSWSPSTGRQRWRAPVAAGQPATVRDGVAYVVAPGQMAAVEVSDGDVLWVHEPGNVAAFDTPAILHGDLVIAANRLGEVIGLERDSGRVAYRVVTDPAPPADDALEAPGAGVAALFGPSDRRVYAGTRDGRLLALDADTGRELWRMPTNLDFSEPVVVPAGQTVVVGGDDATDVVALDAATGVARWRFETGDTVAPVVADGRVYALDTRVADAAHDVVALDLVTGAKEWEVELEHPAVGAVLRLDGLLIVPTAERGAGTNVIYGVR